MGATKNIQEINDRIFKLENELTELYRSRAGKVKESRGNPDYGDWYCIGYCSNCGVNTVDVSAGYDTCDDCVSRI